MGSAREDLANDCRGLSGWSQGLKLLYGHVLEVSEGDYLGIRDGLFKFVSQYHLDPLKTDDSTDTLEGAH